MTKQYKTTGDSLHGIKIVEPIVIIKLTKKIIMMMMTENWTVPPPYLSIILVALMRDDVIPTSN
jgi:hypothetical protein